jgi:hypothetical protein
MLSGQPIQDQLGFDVFEIESDCANARAQRALKILKGFLTRSWLSLWVQSVPD